MDAILNYVKEESFYEIIGCAESADLDQISREYRLKVRTCHPDKTKDKEALRKYEKLTQAYKVLSNEEQRRDYDKWLNSGLCIPYDTWKDKTRYNGHASIHFAKKRKGPLCVEGPSKDEPPSTKQYVGKTEEKATSLKRTLPSSRTFSFGRRSKFQKYMI